MALLEIQGLHCHPRGEPAITDVSLTISRGELVALVGPNGSGKTTLCRCLALLLQPDLGRISVDEHPISGQPWDASRAGLFVVLKGHRVFPEMTVLQNLLVSPVAWHHPNRTQRLEEILALFPEIARRRLQAAGTLSGGEQQMLAIGRAMLASPRVLVVDEPSLGLSPLASSTVYKTLLALRASGTAVLVTEETGERILDIADRLYLIRHGKIVGEGPPATLLHTTLPSI